MKMPNIKIISEKNKDCTGICINCRTRDLQSMEWAIENNRNYFEWDHKNEIKDKIIHVLNGKGIPLCGGTALVRAMAAFSGHINIPKIVNVAIAEIFSDEPLCSEAIITFYAWYYQAIENLPCYDPCYQIDKADEKCMRYIEYLKENEHKMKDETVIIRAIYYHGKPYEWVDPGHDNSEYCIYCGQVKTR